MNPKKKKNERVDFKGRHVRTTPTLVGEGRCKICAELSINRGVSSSRAAESALTLLHPASPAHTRRDGISRPATRPPRSDPARALEL